MQHLQLTIPEPCHQNWEQMTPTQQGRFCNACAKEVIDFSTMTDIQVLNYFTNLTNEKVCGRALPEQLDRTISRPEQPRKRIFWYWNYVVMFLMFFTKGNAAKAQGGIKPVTECSPVKANDIRGKVALNVDKAPLRVITGKVTDGEGNPVSFAVIRIKGTPTTISADANGAYSLRAHSGDVFGISAPGYKTASISVSTLATITTVLEKNLRNTTEVIVTAGAIGFGFVEDPYARTGNFKRVAILEVKDEITGKAIANASLIIHETYKNNIDSFLTDKKGMYKIKGISQDNEYAIKVSAEGYEPNEFTIDGYEFKVRKNVWEVLLKKQEVKPVRSADAVDKGTIRLRGGLLWNWKEEAIYVVDGTIMPKGKDIDPDDIEEINVLQAAEATALFGTKGANGAIVITTRKAKEIKLKEVVVSSTFGILRRTRCTTSCISTRAVADSINTLVKEPVGSLKVYPNPVQRGQQLNIVLDVNQAGQYQLRVTNAAGIVVLQKQCNAATKDFTEKILAESKWSAGIYYVSISDNKNQLVNKSRFVIQ